MLPYQITPSKDNNIAIIGLGGAGVNVLQCFKSSSAENVHLYSMALDDRLDSADDNVEFLQLGGGINHGFGSGGDPEVARAAALDSQERICSILDGMDLVVLVVGLGGGTGSGVAPLLAEWIRERDIFLVSVVTMPFAFEGRRRREQADRSLNEISRLSDIVFCFENDYMEELFHTRSGAHAVFGEVARLLAKATATVPTLANSPGLINLGLDELAVALANNDSRCLFGSGSGYGSKRAKEAAEAALNSPLVSYHNALRFARTVIVHIAGGETMSLAEIRTAMDTVRAGLADEDVTIFFGTSVKARLGDEIRVTLIASIDSQEFKLSLAEPPVPEEDPEEEPAPAPAAPAADEGQGAYTEDYDGPVEEEPAEDQDGYDGVAPEEEYADEEDYTEPEPGPAPAPEPERPLQQGMLLDGARPITPREPELDSMERARRLFVDGGESGVQAKPVQPGQPVAPFSRTAAARHLAEGVDDLDTPPSLRSDVFSKLFPEN